MQKSQTTRKTKVTKICNTCGQFFDDEGVTCWVCLEEAEIE